MHRVVRVLLTAAFAAQLGCAVQDSDTTIRNKLTAILDNDLKLAVEGIKPEGLSDSLHYVIINYESFEKSQYRIKAEVEFHLFKTVRVVLRRKYRYHRDKGMWERYTNEYVFTGE